MSEPPPEPSAGGAGEDGFDAVVIGSGFGGSVAAYRLAKDGKSVCLLERGKAYPPGDFARGVADAQKNFWSPSSGLFGLYDVWSFSRMVAIVSAGLGGGSLIYANVLLRMPEDWFEKWPISRADLDRHYDAVEQMLGATRYPTYLRDSPRTPKTKAFVDGVRAAGLEEFFPNLAITFADPGLEGEQFDDGTNNLHGRLRHKCALVGDCDAGCNFGAKNTLDLTYLSKADRKKLDIRTECEAKRIARLANGSWQVRYVDHANRTEHVLVAQRMIVAAGTLGSTRLLLQSRCDGLPGLSDRLGYGFSGNGDLLTFALGLPKVVDPDKGPVITTGARAGEMYIEDGGGPTAVWWLAELIESPRSAWHFLPRALKLVRKALSHRPEREIGGDLSAFLGDTRLAARSLPMLGMGRDLANGRFVLDVDGLLDVEWEPGDRTAYYRRADAVSKSVADGMQARFSDLPFRLNHNVTVHPLGGCSMGTSAANGVVDGYGKAFGHDGLYVLDGSAMPGPVGANPSLTIAAFADRAADEILRTWP